MLVACVLEGFREPANAFADLLAPAEPALRPARVKRRADVLTEVRR